MPASNANAIRPLPRLRGALLPVATVFIFKFSQENGSANRSVNHFTSIVTLRILPVNRLSPSLHGSVTSLACSVRAFGAYFT
jgi:hypothetical protein